MIFGKKRQERLAQQMATGTKHTYRAMVWKRFRKNRMALWSLRMLYLLIFIAVFADFIANEKPIAYKAEGEWHFPILKGYAVKLGWAQWKEPFLNADWRIWQNLDSEWRLLPLIPYSADTQDRRNASHKGPFETQRIPSKRYHHWLGTDGLGRDVAAGMVHGTRIAMLVGLIAMSIAAFIGITLGALAGYFGDSRLKISVTRLILNGLGLLIGVFYAFKVRRFALSQAGEDGHFLWTFGESLGILLAFLLIANAMAWLLERSRSMQYPVNIPFDILVMRLIEIFNSIPTLLLLLAMLAVIGQSSIFYVMLIIGLIRWTGIARFIRAELLRIRSLSYIEAAEAMGFRSVRILFRHAIPNALTPVLITIAFGIASAILLEASLSFLGIGVDPNTVTWGSMLKTARNQPSAWWLAIFPGLAIFVTVTLFNLIGEGITEAIDPKTA